MAYYNVTSGVTSTGKTLNNDSMGVSNGGTANKTTLDRYGLMDVYFGGFANSTTVNNLGHMNVSSGGKANSTTVNSGGRMYVRSGGTANDTTVNEEGDLTILSDGVANSITVNEKGDLSISSGGTATKIKENGGHVYVANGASVTFAPNAFSNLVLSKTFATVHSGTVANITTVNSDGYLYVYSGGVAKSTTVNSSGYLYVYSSGTANSTTLNSGGRIYVSSGGTVSNTTLNAWGMFVSPGGTANKTTLNSDGRMYVSSGVVVNSTTVNFLGRMEVYAGGTANITTVNSNGRVYVSSGGTANINSVDAWGMMSICGTANSTTVDRGSLYVCFGGVANSTTVDERGGFSIYSNGTANSTTVNYSGSMYVSSGGTANITTVHRFGRMYVFSGGTANTNTVNSNGKVYVSSGGTANTNTVNSNGDLYVYTGGTANTNTVNSNGRVYVSSGGKANSTTVNFGGCLYVYSGGTATNITWTPCEGHVYVSNGGYATFVSEYSGVYYGSDDKLLSNVAVMDGKIVNSLCEMNVMNGGTADSTTVNSNGFVYVSSGGTANNTTVNSGGYLNVYSGGKLTGQMSFANGASVWGHEGAAIDFDISALSPANAALMNDLSRVGGAPLYTLTVSGTQLDGTYKLAGGAAEFDKTITVKSKTAETLGTLMVGQTVDIGGVNYRLDLGTDNVLSVSVGTAAPASAKCDINGNGVSDVMFQYTGGDYQLGYWMDGTNTWHGQGLAKPAEWEVLGSYDMNANGKADAVLVGNVEVGGVKGAYIGYYLDSVDTDANWQNIGYLNNEEDIAWRNKVGNLTGNESANSIVWYAPELYALGVWTDSTTEWVTLSNNFGGDEWTLIGCGDFDGDGRDSVLMSYNGGQKYYSVGIDGTPSELATSDSGWEVRAIGDFYNDKKDDIIAFHKETGIVAMWGDGSSSNWTQLGQLNPDDWFVVGAGDYGGDDCADLLVRQKSTGMLGYYDFGDMDCWNELGRGVDMDWTVIA